MNKLRDMAAFVRVAETGGFTQAARSEGATVSTITKSVANLETALGIQLFQRDTRHLKLTRAGQEFLHRSKSILRDIDDAEEHVRNANVAPSGTVRIALPPSFGRSTFIPALGEFMLSYPEIRLDISLKGSARNPVESGHDLVVHSGRLVDSGLSAIPLVGGTQMTVASPLYLARAGHPLVPEDLPGHNCIVGAFGRHWSFRGHEGTYTVQVSGTIVTDSGDAMLEAASRGLGISHGIWWLFRREIETGQLVSVLDDHQVEAEPISIVFPTNRFMPARVRAVSDFLVALCRPVIAPDPAPRRRAASRTDAAE